MSMLLVTQMCLTFVK